MSISKTRQKLVDVARQLFAKNGIANTTMNDIAVASGKGRRQACGAGDALGLAYSMTTRTS